MAALFNLRFFLFLLPAFLLFLKPSLSYALVSFQSTLSTGYYRDAAQNSQIPVLLYWDFAHTSQNGVETTVDLGLNNAVIKNDWKFFPYQAYVSIPLKNPFEQLYYRQSRLVIGRQLLSEGFEFGLFDGVQLPFYWSEGSGVRLFAGGLNIIEETKIDFSSRVYGAMAQQRFIGALWKTGYIRKERKDLSKDLLIGSVGTQWAETFLQPSVKLMTQFDLGEKSFSQSRGSLEIYPTDDLETGVGYEYQNASELYPADTKYLYRLFSISPQKTLSVNAGWGILPQLRLNADVKLITFRSNAGKEEGLFQEVGATYSFETARIGPVFTNVKSYGGRLFQGGLDFGKNIGRFVELQLRGDVGKIEKINGISGVAYHSRAGLSLRMSNHFLGTAAVEVEKNYVFELNSRAIAYVSYFLY